MRSTPRNSRRELGWQAQENFDSGLAKTVRWYLDNRAWWQDILDRGYKAERLGLTQQRAAEIESRPTLWFRGR